MTTRLGSMVGADARAPEYGPALRHRNEVLLVGRVSSPLEKRELPSGDVVGVVRIVVERGAGSRFTRPGTTRAAVDAIDCAGWSHQAHDAMAHWQVGDVVEIKGALRRRFFRSGPVVSSKYEVEVSRGRRLAHARPASRRRGADGKGGRGQATQSTFVEPVSRRRSTAHGP